MACGIGAVKLSSENAFKNLSAFARSQNNRGDESFGFGFLEDQQIKVEKLLGDPQQLYDKVVSEYGEKKTGLMHNRYATSGEVKMRCAQPLVFDDIAIAHNGNVANTEELKDLYNGLEYNTSSDTEVIGKILSQHETLEDGLSSLERDAVGSFNLGILDSEDEIYLYRDSMGQHPLWYIEGEDSFGMSETFAGHSIAESGAKEVEPGQLVQLGENVEKTQIASSRQKFCPFEVYYFQNPGSRYKDSQIQDIRDEIGRIEASLDSEQDMYQEGGVVPILSSGRHFAYGFVDELGLEIEEGIIKNREARNYMAPQNRAGEIDMTRKEKAQVKHVPLPSLQDRKTILVDDSVVRGDTSKGITESLRDLGVDEVHWKIMFPRLQNPCIFGLDHSERQNLIAVDEDGSLRSESEIAEVIGADSVSYGRKQSFEHATNTDEKDTCWGCVDSSENYPTEIPEEEKSKFI